MSLNKAAKITFTLGSFALLITLFVASETNAQTCQCYHRTRATHVRHVAYHPRARHSYARVRTVYRTVYVTRPASYVEYTDAYNASPKRVVASEPVYDSDGTVEVSDRTYISGYDIDRIARGWGQRDGFKDGWKAALKNRHYDVENNGDYNDADNGYKSRFGSKFLYKTSYREGYVRGYDSGFRSVAGGKYVIKY